MAQFRSATLGINGLTCSLCSYNVEHELSKLACVESVKMELNQNTAQIVFNKNVPVQMKSVIDAVYKAGFSVGFTQALFSFDSVSISNTHSFIYKNDTYQFISDIKTLPAGEVVLKFVDKKFVEPKIYNAWKKQIRLSPQNTTNNSTIYHITW